MRTLLGPTAAVGRYADAALEGCWLVVAALAPLYMDLLRAQPSLARAEHVQILATFAALLWLLQRAAAQRATAPPPGGGSEGATRRVHWRGPLKLPAGAPIVALAAAYAATTLLAAALAPVPGTAWWGAYLRGEGAMAVLGYMVLFLVVADRLRSRAQLDRLVNVLLAASLPVCLYALAQAIGLDPLSSQAGAATRVVATAGNPIFLAAYLILLVPLTVWRLRESDSPVQREGASWAGPLVLGGATVLLMLLLAAGANRPQAWWGAPAVLAAFALAVAVLPPFTLPAELGGDATARRVRRVAYLALVVLQLVAIVLTASRGPVVALVGAVGLGVAFAAWRARQWRHLIALGACGLVLAAGVALLWVPNSPLEPLKARVPLVGRLAAVGSGETGARLQIWRTVSESVTLPREIGAAPDPLGALRLWVGYGPESVVYLLNQVLPPPSTLEWLLGEFWDRSHNATLDHLLTAGLLGLAAYLALVLTAIVVAFRRVPGEQGAFGWGLYFALGVALLAHFLETQLSMLTLPAHAIFWLLAGVAVGAPRLERSPVAKVAVPAEVPPPGRRADRRGARAGSRAGARPSAPASRWWPVAGYAGAAVLAVLLLMQVPAPSALLVATGLAVAAVLAAPLVAGLALAPYSQSSEATPAGGEGGAPPGVPRGPQAVRAVVTGGLAALLALLLCQHQLRALAADVAFRRAETAQRTRDFSGAIASTQQAVQLAPDQAEYYHLLGQYYGALGGSTRTPGLPGYEPRTTDVAAVDPAPLGRDQIFALGRLSVDEALRLDTLEVRYLITLGELLRYWGEVSGEPGHLTGALDAFERAARLKPNDVEIYAGMADTLLLRGEPARAVATARHARELHGLYWYPRDVQARAHQALDQPDEAMWVAGEALASVPLSPGLKSASPFDQQRLREVIRTALASGRTVIRPGELVRAYGSPTIYLVDETMHKRQFVSEAAFAGCGYQASAVRDFYAPVLAELPSGADHPGCR